MDALVDTLRATPDDAKAMVFLNDAMGRLAGGSTKLLDRPWIAAVLAQWLPGREALTVVRRREDLSRPREGFRIGVHYDPDAFGRFSEAIARFLGTGRFLMAQTVLVTVWILINAAAARLRWDPYPFILLNLAFSTQAAYAAPLILLAQNRQDDRDRAQAEIARCDDGVFA